MFMCYVLQHFEIAGKFDHAEDGRMAHLNLETADWADLDDCYHQGQNDNVTRFARFVV